MFGQVYNIVGSTQVEEHNNIVSIKGFPTRSFQHSVSKMWGNTAIGKFMFRSDSSGEVSMDSFFIPDLVYLIERLYSSPKARVSRQSLKRVEEAIWKDTWFTAVKSEFPPITDLRLLSVFKKSMLPHQRDFIKRYDSYTQKYNLNGYLLAAKPGTGKTITSLAWSECLQTEVTIIIAPSNSISRVWMTTLETEFKEKRPYWTTADTKKIPPLGARYYVFHYEALGLALELAKSLKGTNVNIVLDECHNFNEIKAQRTEKFVELCRTLNCKHVLWMSGTPIKAMGAEVIPLLRTIDPLFNIGVEERFKKIFGLSSSRGLDILASRLGYMSFRVEKDFIKNKVLTYIVKVKLANGIDYTLDVIKKKMSDYITERTKFYHDNMAIFLKQYQDGLKYHESELKTPAELDVFSRYVSSAQKLHVSYDPALDKELVIFCNKYEKEKILPSLPGTMREQFRKARSVYKYVYLSIQGETLGLVLGKERLRCNLDIALAMQDVPVTLQDSDEAPFNSSLLEIMDNSVNKTVIFSDYTEVVNGVSDQLKKEGYTPLRILAETNKDLPAIIHTFEKSKEANPLIATYKSLSTAVPLVMADSVVFLNMPYRIHEYEQALARLDRIGQPETIKAYQVFLDTGEIPNISTRSKDILSWSKEMVESIMGKPVVSTDLAMEMFFEEQSIANSRTVVEKFFPSW